MTNRTIAVLSSLLGSALACSSPRPQVEPEQAPQGEVAKAEFGRSRERTRLEHAKTLAPVDLALQASGASGRVKATLSITARADIPRAVARFVLPAGVTLLEGVVSSGSSRKRSELELDLGALARGQTHRLEITVAVPAKGSHLIAAGLDAHMTAGIKLHKGTTVALGQHQAADQGQHMQLPEGGQLRVGDAK